MWFHVPEWHAWRGSLLALAVSLGLVMAGRFLRVRMLEQGAAGAGVVAGWLAVTGRFWTAGGFSVGRLAGLAAGALALGLLCVWIGPGRRASAVVLLAALCVGWLFIGEPHHLVWGETRWPIGAGVALGVVLFARAIANNAAGPVAPVMAGFTLAAGLYFAATPFEWTQLALVIGFASVAMLVPQATPGLVALPLAIDSACLASLAVITLGRLPRLAVSSVDIAALLPLVALWLQPRLTERLRVARGAAPLAGGLLAGAVAAGCVWLAHQVLRL